MIKKVIIGISIFFILSMSGITSYANNTASINQADIRKTGSDEYFFEILEPEKNIVTTHKSMLLSFKASKGTSVCIEVYHNNSIEDGKEKYILLYDPIDITVGALQRGWASIDLKSGLNKVQFTIKYTNGLENSMGRTINVMNIKDVKQLLQDVVNESTLGIWKKQ